MTKNIINASWKTETIPFLSIIYLFFAGIIFYNSFPERVPSHWNLMGQVDQWSSAGFAAFFVPCLTVALYGLFLFLPNIDTHKDRYKDFSKQYHNFKAIFMVFFCMLYTLVGLAGMGFNVPIDFWVSFLVGIVIFFIGTQLSGIKRNSFFGLRTPWTMSSDKVWDRTHAVAGKIFMLAGICLALAGVLPNAWSRLVMLGAFCLLVLSTIFYSYYIYLKDGKGK